MANPMLNKMMELLTHHYNLTGALSREAAAKGYGIDPEPYKHPYPGSTNYTVQLMTPGEAKAEAKADLTGLNLPLPSPTKQGSGWLPWLIGGGLVGGPLLAIATMIGLGGFIPKPQPAAATPIVNVPPSKGLEGEIEVRWGAGEGPNGTYGARYRLGPDKEWIQLPGPNPPK